eukprot:52885-Eustigmatos_ZCMA.PRE.1
MEGMVVGVGGSGGKSEGVGGMNVWVDGVPPTCKRGHIVLVKLGAAEDGQAQEAYAECWDSHQRARAITYKLECGMHTEVYGPHGVPG